MLPLNTWLEHPIDEYSDEDLRELRNNIKEGFDDPDAYFSPRTKQMMRERLVEIDWEEKLRTFRNVSV